MHTSVSRSWRHPRALLATGLLAASLTASLGVAVQSSSALGSSPFCKLLLTYKPVAEPTTITVANYSKWAKTTLPFFEKLAAAAPNAKTKTELNSLVTLIKYEANATSVTALKAYVIGNSAKWAQGAEALVKSALACV